MTDRQTATPSISDMRIYNIEERVKLIEENLYKNVKRKRATKSQKLLLFKEFGFLEIIESLNLSQNKKALLVSVLIDADPDNVEKDLNQINLKSSELTNKPNYEFLAQLYKDLGLQSLHKKALNKVLDVEKAKEKSPKKN